MAVSYTHLDVYKRQGRTFANENPADLARVLVDLLRDRDERLSVAAAGALRARVFDWSVVAEDVMAVYETVTAGAAAAADAADPSGLWARVVRMGRGSGLE